ncbi:hypothetical protein [Bordetella sp. 02P26C-1]|uniref:hypothetical protein n=1 Tax=Bordetella sp. 02P26C-1 TaxID=2683195 RepID=UPI0013558DDF|nr:hypothetical protein [Bordetella sp. 02P26C-1]MVW78509.1 hypothetical protein [Bordetella sp. 02P26C-1]
MRELSLQELHQAYGGKVVSQPPSQEIVSTTATIGHAVGIFFRGITTQDYDGSVTELAASIKYCRKLLSSVHSLDPMGKLKRFQPLTAIFHLGCGIYKGMYPDRRGA